MFSYRPIAFLILIRILLNACVVKESGRTDGHLGSLLDQIQVVGSGEVCLSASHPPEGAQRGTPVLCRARERASALFGSISCRFGRRGWISILLVGKHPRAGIIRCHSEFHCEDLGHPPDVHESKSRDRDGSGTSLSRWPNNGRPADLYQISKWPWRTGEIAEILLLNVTNQLTITFLMTA